MLDTNVLLGLYRLSPSAREDTLRVLQSVQDRLWIPHQVGREFFANLDGVRDELPAAYAKVKEALSKARKSTSDAFGGEKRFADSQAAVSAKIGDAFEALLLQLDMLASSDEARVTSEDDPVFDKVDRLLEGHIGPEPQADVTRSWVEEFIQWRAPNRIPPGWKDASDSSKSTDLRRAGDFVLWRQILLEAGTRRTPVLFVTNDNKDDWWAGPRGQRTGPLPDLLIEFAGISKHGYHQMTLDRFLSQSATYGFALAKSTVEEVARESAREQSTDEVRAPDSARRQLGSDLFMLIGPEERTTDDWYRLAIAHDRIHPDKLARIVENSFLWDDMNESERRDFKTVMANLSLLRLIEGPKK